MIIIGKISNVSGENQMEEEEADVGANRGTLSRARVR